MVTCAVNILHVTMVKKKLLPCTYLSEHDLKHRV